MNARSNLSRACTWLIALALLVQLVCPLIPAASAEAATVTQSTNVVMNFDNWLSLDGRLTQDGDPVAVELIDQTVKMTVGTPAAGGANVGLVPDVTDWSGGVGLQMYVKNLSDTAVMAISPRFFCYNNANQQDFMLLQNGAPYSLASGETVTSAASSYGFVMLPAGFEGYVRMPFTSFGGAWYGTQSANLNLAGAGLVYTSFDTVNFGGAVIIDDISVIKANQMANVEDFHTWFANQAGADSNIGVSLVNNGSHGMSLKLSILSAVGLNFANLNTTVNNWSGKGALQLYVKNLSGSQMAFQPRFFASNGTATDLWYPVADTPVRYVQNNQVTAGTATYGYVWVPADFEGYIQIPFSGYVGAWYPESVNSALNLSVISGTYFFFDTAGVAAAPGMSMLVDEIGLLNGLSEVTPEPGEPESEDPNIVESFNTWTDTSKIAHAGDPLSWELVNESKYDNALKITVTGAISGATNVATAGFTPSKTDWNGKAGLEFYMENLSNGNLAVSIRFDASNGAKTDRWMVGHGTPVKLISDSGVVTDTAIVYGFVMLPANFKGQIRIPFSSFTGGWYGSANDTLNLSVISGLYFVYDTNPAGSYLGKSMIVDDIKLIDSLDDGIPTVEDIKEDVDNGLAALLDVVPEVEYLPDYDPKSSATGTNEWSNIKALTFDGANIGEDKTKVFAYIGYPENISEKSPAIVLVHGGMGHPFAEWIKLWTDRGYVAIAFENTGYFPTAAGKGLAGRETDPTSYWVYGLSGDFAEDGYVNAPTNSGMQDVKSDAEAQWMYHAVAQTILAHNILRNDPAVDSSRIGITGVSWGGTITSIAIGHDTRYDFAIPVYCAGYLEDSLGNMSTYFNTEACNTIWAAEDRFDKVNFPVLWLDWNNDFSCSIISTGRSYLATKDNNEKTSLSIIDNMQHSHSSAWNQNISYRFADWVTSNGAGLTQLETMPAGWFFNVPFTAPADATSVSAKLYYITEEMTYSVKSGESSLTIDQTWQTSECTVSGNTISCDVPDDAYSYYLEITTVTPSGNYVTASPVINTDPADPKEPVAQIGDVPYASVQVAADTATATDIVKLLSDSEEEVTVAEGKILNLDLNGKNLKKVTVNGIFNGMDSTTDGYDCTNGYGKIAKIEGDYSKNHRIQVGNNGQYYVAAEETNGVSFHRFYVGITHMALRPGIGGAGYTMTLAGDEKVKAMLNVEEAYGYTVYLKDENGQAIEGASITCTGSQEDFQSGKQKMEALTINNILKAGADNNADRATKYQIAVEAFVTFGDTKVTGVAPVAMTFKQIVEATDAGLAGRELSDAEKDALLDLYQILADSQITDWNIPNIKALAEA